MHALRTATQYGMKVIRHAGVDSRMIILDDHMYDHAVCLTKSVMGETLH